MKLIYSINIKNPHTDNRTKKKRWMISDDGDKNNSKFVIAYSRINLTLLNTNNTTKQIRIKGVIHLTVIQPICYEIWKYYIFFFFIFGVIKKPSEITCSQPWYYKSYRHQIITNNFKIRMCNLKPFNVWSINYPVAFTSVQWDLYQINKNIGKKSHTCLRWQWTRRENKKKRKNWWSAAQHTNTNMYFKCAWSN